LTAHVAIGKEITDEVRNKESWDSNAITPGTPFMDLLASSLRYWVVQKMNTDPGWKGVCAYMKTQFYPDLFCADASYYFGRKRSWRR
jgi:5'-3' exonuclease